MNLIFWFNGHFVKGFSPFKYPSIGSFRGIGTLTKPNKNYSFHLLATDVFQRRMKSKNSKISETDEDRVRNQSPRSSTFSSFFDNYNFKVNPGTIYYVSTPLGNLGDLTFRAFEVLRKVDFIASEDTRNTGLLLQKLGLPKKSFISYHKFNEMSRSKELIDKASQGYSIAVVSDAGTPGISDPGAILANDIWNQNCDSKGFTVYSGSNNNGATIKLQPIPGPSALISAMSVSGFLSGEFTFLGFLPQQASKRKNKLLNALNSNCDGSVILYEAPHRLKKTLMTLISLGYEAEQILVARELTKIHEDIFRGTVLEALYYYYPEAKIIDNVLDCNNTIDDEDDDSHEHEEDSQIAENSSRGLGVLKGEFTLIIQSSEKPKYTKVASEDGSITFVNSILAETSSEKTQHEKAVDSVLEMSKREGVSISEAVKHISKSSGMKKSKLYNAVLAKKRELDKNKG